MHDVATQQILSEMDINGHGAKGEPYFIGWFSPLDPPVGYVGRLVQWLPAEEGKPRRCAYVCLPSFNSGVAFNGQSIDQGRERVGDVCSMEDMRRMFVEGLRRLKEVVENA